MRGRLYSNKLYWTSQVCIISSHNCSQRPYINQEHSLSSQVIPSIVSCSPVLGSKLLLFLPLSLLPPGHQSPLNQLYFDCYTENSYSSKNLHINELSETTNTIFVSKRHHNFFFVRYLNLCSWIRYNIHFVTNPFVKHSTLHQ